MTGFQISGEWLDFAGTVSLEIRSPLFDFQSIPGVLSYPAAFQDTPRNRRLLAFPAARARRVGPVPALPADLYLGGLLWRRGALQFQSFDSAKGEYSYQFQADADALAPRIQDVLLSDLALGSLPLQLVAETDDYVLAPIRNNTFYGEKNPAWGKVVNAYSRSGAVNVNGAGAHTYTQVPLLKVVPLLRRCFALYGYELAGSWLDDPEIQQLVLYSLASLDQAAGTAPAGSFAIAGQLPGVRLVELLLALQQTFALAFVFDPVRPLVRLVPLREVVARAGYQMRQAGASYTDQANQENGYTLGFTADSADELLKAAPWPGLVLGAGAEQLVPALDTLRIVAEADPLNPARRWLVPAAEQAGYSARTDFEQTDNRGSQLRLLFYRGLQPDDQGTPYPLASAGTQNYAGTSVGSYALQWDGPQGLYQQWHKPWLDFRANARQEERPVQLTLGELLGLDPTRKDLVGGLLFLWERVSVRVGGAQGLAPATVTYHQIAT